MDTWGKIPKGRKILISLVAAAILFALGTVIFIIREAVRIRKHGGELNQLHYRWRNDDGDKLTATWAAPQDSSILRIPKNETRRLRILIANQGGLESLYVRYQLEYATSVEGAWVPVGLNGSTDKHWALSYSPHIVDGVSTTNLPDGIEDPPGIFVAGEFRDTNNRTGPITLPPGAFTELEFAIVATDNATDDGTYYFRIARARTTAHESVRDAIFVSTGVTVGKITDAFRTK